MLNAQFPHTLKKDDQYFRYYTLTLENNYPEEIEVNNVLVTINSRIPISNCSILLSDIDEELIDISIKDHSELLLRTPSLSGGQLITILYECNPSNEEIVQDTEEAPKTDIFKTVEYDLFGKHHACECWKGEDTPTSKKIYDRDEIVFEKSLVIDYRKLPDKLKYEYQYANYSFENNERNISVFCTADKHLNLAYDDLNGSLRFKSNDVINDKISLLRLMSFMDGSFLHESTIPIAKVKQSPQKNAEWNCVLACADQSFYKNYEKQYLSRTFCLLKEKGAKISLECPGPKCYQFELGSFEERDGILWQQIYISGEGFGFSRDKKDNLIFSVDKLMVLHGGAHPGLDMKTGRMFASIPLRQGAYFEIYPDDANIKFIVVDTKADSLRIKLEIKPKV